MKKMTYDEYEQYSIENSEQFSEEFDEFIDMENTGDLHYECDFEFPYGIAAPNKNADVVAAWLPDDQYIFSHTSVPEVLEYIAANYPEFAESIRDTLVEMQGKCRIHNIKFYPSGWSVFTSDGCFYFAFEPAIYENEDEAYEGWVDWCNEHDIDENSIKQYEVDVKIRTSNQVY